jgi:hypothetical protein
VEDDYMPAETLERALPESVRREAERVLGE